MSAPDRPSIAAPGRKICRSPEVGTSSGRVRRNRLKGRFRRDRDTNKLSARRPCNGALSSKNKESFLQPEELIHPYPSWAKAIKNVHPDFRIFHGKNGLARIAGDWQKDCDRLPNHQFFHHYAWYGSYTDCLRSEEDRKSTRLKSSH